MTQTKDLKQQLKSKIDIIKKINDNNGSVSVIQSYIDDIKDTDKHKTNTLDSFSSKALKKKNNNKDIFSELVIIVGEFVGLNESVQSTDPFTTNSKLKTFAIDSAEESLKITKELLIDEVQKALFTNENTICGVDTTIPLDEITISPSEFDFLNTLKVSPETSMGTLLYEPTTPDIGGVKMNRVLYDTFTNPPYDFITPNNTTLFNLSWGSGGQEYTVSGLNSSGNVKIFEFLNDYYSSVEFPDINVVLKNAMGMILKGDNSTTIDFSKSMNDLNRLLNKIFSICGTKTTDDLKQDARDEFNENDEDINSYFDFNSVEGIDLDDEEDRYNKVLRFTDCGSFTSPVNTDFIDDFAEFSEDEPIKLLIDDTLRKVAKDIYSSEGLTITIPNLQLSLLKQFIVALPKALVASILSPKLLFPIVLMWKQLRGVVTDVKTMMKELANMFTSIIKKVFWKFITEFWNLVKPELIRFISKLAANIIANKYKRYIAILTGLIALIKKLLTVGIGSCADLFGTMSNIINLSLTATGPSVNIPGFVLGFSDFLPGYSQDRAFMNISEKIEAAGIDLSPINGESNDVSSMVKAIVDGNIEEMDQNSYFKGSNKLTTIPTPIGPIQIPPGIINVSGKQF